MGGERRIPDDDGACAEAEALQGVQIAIAIFKPSLSAAATDDDDDDDDDELPWRCGVSPLLFV